MVQYRLQSEMTSRRAFLSRAGEALGIIVAAVGMPAGTVYLLDSWKKNGSVNQGFSQFPEQLPGASAVRKYETRGATHCLVHIRQLHDIPGLNYGELQEVQHVQNNIYSILSYLVDRHDISEVYAEGMTFEINEQIEPLRHIIKATQRKLDTLSRELIGGLERKIRHLQEEPHNEADIMRRYHAKQEAERYKKKLGDEMEELNKSYLKARAFAQEADRLRKERDGRLNAVERLAEEGRLRVLHGETLEGNLAGSIVARAYLSGIVPKSSFDALALERREDILLEVIAQKSDNLAVAVYGGGHNFLDNICWWNDTQNHKFSLIEVDPEEYPKVK